MKYRKMTEAPLYSTVDIKKLYGLSTKGLFYYEDKGIISPRRENENRYRVFSSEECARLYQARLYRSMHFSMEESVQMIRHVTYDEMMTSMQHKQEMLTREAQELLLLSAQIEKTTELLSSLNDGHKLWEYKFCSEMMRVFIQRHDAPDGRTTCENMDEYQTWCAGTPFTAASIMISRESLKKDRDYAYSLGFIAETEAAARLNLRQSENTLILPPRLCLHTIISGENTDYFTATRFLSTAKQIEEEGWKIAGDPFTRMIGTFDLGQGMLRYDEAWFPVEKK